MQRRTWRARDIISAVIGSLTAISIVQSGGGAIDVLIGVGVNIGIVYGIASVIEWIKNR